MENSDVDEYVPATGEETQLQIDLDNAMDFDHMTYDERLDLFGSGSENMQNINLENLHTFEDIIVP